MDGFVKVQMFVHVTIKPLDVTYSNDTACIAISVQLDCLYLTYNIYLYLYNN